MSRDADIDRAAEFHDAIHAHWEREGMSRTHTHSVVQHAHGGYDEHEHRIEDTAAAEKRLAALEGALSLLLEDTEHKDHDCGDEEWCPVRRARALLDSPEKTT